MSVPDVKSIMLVGAVWDEVDPDGSTKVCSLVQTKDTDMNGRPMYHLSRRRQEEIISHLWTKMITEDSAMGLMLDLAQISGAYDRLKTKFEKAWKEAREEHFRFYEVEDNGL